MHDHIRDGSHEHQLKYCEKCDVVYCEDCKRERGNHSEWTYPYWIDPYRVTCGWPTPDITYGTTGTCERTISSDVTIDCNTDTICSH